jgi:hypothetical protein
VNTTRSQAPPSRPAPGWYLGKIDGSPQEKEAATSLAIRPIVARKIERKQDIWCRGSDREGEKRITFDACPICADGLTTARWGDGDEYVPRSPDGKYWSRDQGSLEDEAYAVRLENFHKLFIRISFDLGLSR